MRFKSCPLTTAWVGTFYGFSNGYSTYIRNVHDESFLHGLSVVVVSIVLNNIQCFESELAEIIL